jgi:hypothetical protein
MLIKDNFTISGVLNVRAISEPNIGLSFDGTGLASTELPVYANGSFSIETWFSRTPNTAGTLFSYGANESYISLGFTADSKAVLTIGSETYTSTSAITITNDATWKYISLCYDRENKHASAYVLDGVQTIILFDNKSFNTVPETQGKLYVGNNKTGNSGFSGATAFLHFRTATRSIADLADKNTTKVGNEPNLVGYWEMDEGKGAVAADKARARNLVLNTGWYIYPSGKAASVNGVNQSLEILSGTFPFGKNDDFTVEFQFKGGAQSGTRTLFSCGNGLTDNDVSQSLSVAVNASKQLILRAAGQTQTLTATDVLNNEWHHIALSVKRGGTTNVYLDGQSVAQFNSAAIQTVAGGEYVFGANKYRNAGLTLVTDEYFNGSFDEIRVWSSALNSSVITLNKDSKLRGNETGLKAYYPFEKYVKESNGLVTVTATNDDMVTGSLQAGGVNSTDAAASMKDCRPVENVTFDFVASSNKIVFNLLDDLSRIEKSTLTLTAKNILDLHNNKNDEILWTAYVNLNNLRWETTNVNLVMNASESKTFTATIVNTGGTTTDYYIESLPAWLTINAPSGTLQPLATKQLTFTVRQGVNIGSYEAAIVLIGVNDVKEILPVTLKVMGERPDWSVNPADFESSMNIIGQIKIAGVFQEDEDDILAAFIGDLCVGVASPLYNDYSNTYFVFIDVWGNETHINQTLTFKLWDASTGRIYPKIQTSAGDIRFSSWNNVGSITNPVAFDAIDIAEQTIHLNKGWTWMSVNVTNTEPSILNQVKTSLSEVGLLIKGVNSYIQQPKWAGNLSEISEKSMYMVNASQTHTLVLEGRYANPETTSVTIIPGWSWIGYVPSSSLPVKSALAGINVQIGDQVKAQSGFSAYIGAGNWAGTLTDMQPGKGYMYYSSGTSTQTFNYPSVALRASSLKSDTDTQQTKWSVNYQQFPTSMTITAIALNNNVVLQSDQIEIAAFSGSECRGSTLLQQVEGLENPYLAFLMVYGESGDEIQFRIYDHATDTEYAASGPVYNFYPDRIYGNPLQPEQIVANGITGLNGIDVDGFIISPNPVKDKLYLHYKASSPDLLEIFEITGRLLMKTNDFNGESLEVSHLRKGTYLLKITRNGETSVHKFIKQ